MLIIPIQVKDALSLVEVFAGCTRGIADQLSYVEEEASVL
jgi:hypothetical protein